jgi:hypothetical protein
VGPQILPIFRQPISTGWQHVPIAVVKRANAVTAASLSNASLILAKQQPAVMLAAASPITAVVATLNSTIKMASLFVLRVHKIAIAHPINSASTVNVTRCAPLTKIATENTIVYQFITSVCLGIKSENTAEINLVTIAARRT